MFCLIEVPSFCKADSSQRSSSLQKLVTTERALYRKLAPVPLAILWNKSPGTLPAAALSQLPPFNDGKKEKSKVPGLCRSFQKKAGLFLTGLPDADARGHFGLGPPMFLFPTDRLPGAGAEHFLLHRIPLPISEELWRPYLPVHVCSFVETIFAELWVCFVFIKLYICLLFCRKRVLLSTH